MQIELAQISIRDGETQANLEKVLALIDQADVAGGTELVLFPETALTGFPTRENIQDLAEPLDGPIMDRLREAARQKGVAIALGFAERDGDRFYNSAVLIDKQGITVLNYRKTHSWATDSGVFTPGDRFVAAEWNGIVVGLLICFDVEFPETARAVAALGVDLLLVADGNMAPYGPVHARALAVRAMENQIFVAMANRCGQTRRLHFPGESVVIDPFGEGVAMAGAEETLLRTRLDFSRRAASRADYDYLRQARVPLGLVREDSGRMRGLKIVA